MLNSVPGRHKLKEACVGDKEWDGGYGSVEETQDTEERIRSHMLSVSPEDRKR